MLINHFRCGPYWICQDLFFNERDFFSWNENNHLNSSFLGRYSDMFGNPHHWNSHIIYFLKRILLILDLNSCPFVQLQFLYKQVVCMDLDKSQKSKKSRVECTYTSYTAILYHSLTSWNRGSVFNQKSKNTGIPLWCCEPTKLGGGFNYFLFSPRPLLGEDSHFDEHIFSHGLKRPTRKSSPFFQAGFGKQCCFHVQSWSCDWRGIFRHGSIR